MSTVDNNMLDIEVEEVNVLPRETPNKIIKNPKDRKTLNIIISTIAVITGTAIAIDFASPELDYGFITTPISAGVLYLATYFNIGVTLPNYPK